MKTTITVLHKQRTHYTKRTKHIYISYHFTRQMIDENVVVLKIDTADQVADMLTKPLGNVLFSKHFKMLKMKDTKVSFKYNREIWRRYKQNQSLSSVGWLVELLGLTTLTFHQPSTDSPLMLH